jgi:hypothetical protein
MYCQRIFWEIGGGGIWAEGVRQEDGSVDLGYKRGKALLCSGVI